MLRNLSFRRRPTCLLGEVRSTCSRGAREGQSALNLDRRTSDAHRSQPRVGEGNWHIGVWVRMSARRVTCSAIACKYIASATPGMALLGDVM